MGASLCQQGYFSWVEAMEVWSQSKVWWCIDLQHSQICQPHCVVEEALVVAVDPEVHEAG
jgi:hypothetical protein